MTEKKIGILIRRPCKKERIERKINEHRKEGEYITKLPQACKSWKQLHHNH